jgi:hypothetical protein
MLVVLNSDTGMWEVFCLESFEVMKEFDTKAEADEWKELNWGRYEHKCD